jgi:hypothetical protein
MAFIYSLTDTWADAGVTFTGIGLNVTDSASNALSNLLNLQVGGSSIASVRKNGVALFGPTAAFVNGIGVGTPALNVGDGASVATAFAGGQVNVWTGNVNSASLNSGGVALRATGAVTWGSGTSVGTPDTILVRDAAGTLAQRNGTNAQTLRVYNTFTDASNYERGSMRWNTNILQIGTEAAGTGTVRSVQVVAGSTSYFFNADEVAVFPATGSLQFNGRARIASPALGIVRLTEHNGANAGALELPEWAAAPAAPATNSVRIYAEDNGSGKTRLMARFATGAAVQIAIEP